jgi:hypothetical protein
MIRTYKIYRKPIQRTDGKWLTSDLYAAGFFVARGSECVGVEPTSENKRYAIVISPREAFTQDIEDWCSNATVPVREFLDGVYLVNSLIREFGDGHERARCNGGGNDGTRVGAISPRELKRPAAPATRF